MNTPFCRVGLFGLTYTFYSKPTISSTTTSITTYTLHAYTRSRCRFVQPQIIASKRPDQTCPAWLDDRRCLSHEATRTGVIPANINCWRSISKMASSTATKKLPTVAVFTYYLSKNTLKSSRGLPIGEDFDAEWRKRMGNVPYQKIDIEKPMDEVLPLLQEAEVILGDANLIGPIFGKLTKTRWIQGTWAGVDSMMKKIDPSALPPPFIFTRLGGALPTVMAEYVIGNMIALERGFLQMQRNQEQRVWQKLDYRSLEQITIGIVGLGDIGEEIARLCKAFKMTIWGLGRRELAPDQTRKYVDHYRTLPGLTELLANCDYICNVLPKTAATDDLLSGDMLANCTRAPVLINVGRGNVISEESLLAALDKGWISHAILDVFRTEPLPESSLLWTSPKVTISPHNSAFSFTFKICETFADNFDRYINGQPLKYQVNWDIGY